MVLVGCQRVPDHHHLCGVQPVDVMLPLYTSLWCSVLPSEGACGPRSLSWCAPSWWGAGLTLSRLSRGRVLWGGTTQHRPHGFQLRFCSGLNTLGGNEYPETNSDLSGNVNSTSKLQVQFFNFLTYLTIFSNVTLKTVFQVFAKVRTNLTIYCRCLFYYILLHLEWNLESNNKHIQGQIIILLGLNSRMLLKEILKY